MQRRPYNGKITREAFFNKQYLVVLTSKHRSQHTVNAYAKVHRYYDKATWIRPNGKTRKELVFLTTNIILLLTSTRRLQQTAERRSCVLTTTACRCENNATLLVGKTQENSYHLRSILIELGRPFTFKLKVTLLASNAILRIYFFQLICSIYF